MSYLQIKTLVEQQVEVANTPLIVDFQLQEIARKHNIDELKMHSLVLKVNSLMKRHNKSLFNKQAIHQIVQQVVKAENDHVSRVRTALAAFSSLAIPVSLPNLAGDDFQRVSYLRDIVQNLPEPRHLFAVYDEEAWDKEREENADNADVIDEVHREVQQKMHEREAEAEAIREEYATMRTKLLLLIEEVAYKTEKLDYLRRLGEKLNEVRPVQVVGARVDSDCEEEVDAVELPAASNLDAQIARFRILLEKLSGS